MDDMEKIDFLKDRNVFITGATGVVGSNLTRKLVELGANTTILMRDWVPKSYLLEDQNTLKHVNIVRGDLEDYDLLVRALSEYEIECVFHLGAQTIVKTGNINPIATFKSNIEGMWNILDAVRMLSYNSDQIKGVIVASSDKAYGTSENLPYTESMPLNGEHPYDVSKSCGDLIAQSYFKTYKIPLSIVRMGNIYGPGDLNYNRIIPGTIKSRLLHKKPIIRSDGLYVREYFYVDDAVNANLELAKAVLNKKFWGEAFNFSSGEQYTVIDIVKKILAIMNSTLEPAILNEAKNEIKEQFLSIEKAKRLLNWQPIYTTEEGLRYTIEWYKKAVFR